MNKAWAVFKREYLEVVRKKSFIIMTILLPFLMAAAMFVPTLLVTKGMGEKRVAVVDATGRLRQVFSLNERAPKPATGAGEEALRGARAEEMADALKLRFEYAPATGDPKTAAQPWLDRLVGKGGAERDGIDGVLVIPSDAFTSGRAKLEYYSRSSADFVTKDILGGLVNAAISRARLASRGIPAADVDDLLRRLPVETVKLSKSGEATKTGELSFLVAFVFAALLMIPNIIHGQEVMRGIVQEKSERIVEILVSSMSAMRLLTGKVLGLAAAGLTQVAAWLVMLVVLVLSGGSIAAAAGANVLQSFDLGLVPWFIVFYLLGYLVYVCLYAVAGAVSNSEKEAQQLLGPLILVAMLPWFLLFPIIESPESTLAVVISLIPIFTPISMFVRVVVSEPPAWQLAASVALTSLTIGGMFWATAKIFRLGILSYGKRPSIPELVRWLKVA